MSAFLNFADRHDHTDGVTTQLLIASGRGDSAEEALVKAHEKLMQERRKLASGHPRKVYLNDNVMVMNQQFFKEVQVTLAQEWADS